MGEPHAQSDCQCRHFGHDWPTGSAICSRCRALGDDPSMTPCGICGAMPPEAAKPLPDAEFVAMVQAGERATARPVTRPPAPPSANLPCGHPAACAITSDAVPHDGSTWNCGWCAEVAALRAPPAELECCLHGPYIPHASGTRPELCPWCYADQQMIETRTQRTRADEAREGFERERLRAARCDGNAADQFDAAAKERARGDRAEAALYSFYLGVESVMRRLDVDDHPAADDLRDVMDSPWHALADALHETLKARGTLPDVPGYPPGPRETSPQPGAAPQRTKLPDERQSVTHHVELLTPQDGKIDVYAIVGLYPDGRPGELFLRMGGAGTERYVGLADAFAIVLSIALQYGVPLSAVTGKLRGTHAQPTGRCGERMDASLLDLIARWLEERFGAPMTPEVTT